MNKKSCKEIVEKISELKRGDIKFDQNDSIGPYLKAFAFLESQKAYATHKFGHVQKGPYMYSHECINCGTEYKWYLESE